MNRSYFPLCLVILQLLLSSLASATDSQADTHTGTHHTGTHTDTPLHHKINSLSKSESRTIQNRKININPVFLQLYQDNDFQPLWKSNASISDLITAISAAVEDGLPPESYHYTLLQQLLPQVKFSSKENDLRMDLDILATDSLVHLSRHLYQGKVDPKKLHPDWNFAYEKSKQPSATQLASWITDEKISTWLASVSPQHPMYEVLKRNLKEYRALAEDAPWHLVPAGPTLRLGDTDPRVVDLRTRLIAEGAEFTNNRSSSFDKEVDQAVRVAQQRYFLSDDGLVGKATVAALNVPISSRVNQIRVNLERMRWVMQDIKSRFLLVDIAGFEAWYYENGNPVWSARVQVGKPFRKTPVFQDKIRYLEFNPTWTVPKTVLENDIWPMLMQDPHHLEKNNMLIVDYENNILDETELDLNEYTGANFPFLIRQMPGNRNALGLVKFMFPNSHDIYLHDTPNKQLFNSSARTFSSGCIRVERPFELVDILLKDNARDYYVDENNIRKPYNGYKEILDSQQTARLHLKDPVPIFLLYWTSRAQEDGTIRFKGDVYDQDSALLKELDAL